MTRETFEFEVCIPVENFLDDEMAKKDLLNACDEAFEYAQQDTNQAKYDLAGSLENYGYEITGTRFLEFDSFNISHAYAYYAVAIEMERKDAEAFAKAYYGWSDAEVTEFFPQS